MSDESSISTGGKNNCCVFKNLNRIKKNIKLNKYVDGVEGEFFFPFFYDFMNVLRWRCNPAEGKERSLRTA